MNAAIKPATNLKGENAMLSLETTKSFPFDFGTQENLAIMLDGKKIGSMVVLHYEDGKEHVDGIEIEKEFRCNGYGTEILSKFSGAYIVPDNARAANLYARIGSEINANDEFSYLDEGFGVYVLD